jgi:hypothetical protein
MLFCYVDIWAAHSSHCKKQKEVFRNFQLIWHTIPNYNFNRHAISV